MQCRVVDSSRENTAQRLRTPINRQLIVRGHPSTQTKPNWNLSLSSNERRLRIESGDRRIDCSLLLETVDIHHPNLVLYITLILSIEDYPRGPLSLSLHFDNNSQR